MRFIWIVAVLFVLFGFAPAQDWAKKKLDASPRHQEWVKVKNGSRTVDVFVVYPERATKAPAVVLIHEIFGMSDWIEGVADQIAEHGDIAIVPDLLSGMGPNGGRTTDFGGDQQKIMEAVSNLPTPQVVGDLNAACDCARSIPSYSGKLAVAGFCWGGTQSFNFATQRPDLRQDFVFYGIGPTDPAKLAGIPCPVFGFYAGDDNRVTTTVDDQKKLMKAANKRYEAAVYPGAGHGFMRAGEQPDAKPGNKSAHDKAWRKMLAELRRLG